MRKILKYLASVICVFVLAGCMTGAELAAITGGSATVGGAIYWLTNQPWMAKICYWVGDEAALTAMPSASANVDVDTIAFCDEGIAYLDIASGVPAATVNANLAAALAKLPTAQVAWIQGAATILDEFLPPSTALTPLTSNQIADIEGLLKGVRDGTQTCLDNLPAGVVRALAKAQAQKSGLRSKHPTGLKAAHPGGWFVQVKK